MALGAKPIKLFVYGSLKKGFFNHERFGFDKLKFLGEKTLKGFELINLGAYPGMLSSGNLESEVHGEVYEMDLASPLGKEVDLVERGAGFRTAIVEDGSKGVVHGYLYTGGEDGPTVPGGKWVE